MSEIWDQFLALKADNKIEFAVYFFLYFIAAILMLPSLGIYWLVNKLNETE